MRAATSSSPVSASAESLSPLELSDISSDPATPAKGGRKRSITPQRQQFSSRRSPSSASLADPRHMLTFDERSWSILSRQQSSEGKASDGFLQKTVVVRVRPFTGEEKSLPRRILSAPAADRVLIVNPRSFHADPDTIAAAAMLANNPEWAKDFRFSHCLWSLDDQKMKLPEPLKFADQEEVFRIVGTPIVENVLRGVSAACFAYGHTGSGKTYTMFGAQGSSDEASEGLIPRILRAVLEDMEPETKLASRFTLSFLEIYNERIHDLLRVDEEKGQLRVREHPAIGTYVENLTKVEIRTDEEVRSLLAEGLSRRSTSASSRNLYSSRSHALVTLEITPNDDAETSYAPANGVVPISPLAKDVEVPTKRYESVRVQLIDLAGSEKDVLRDGSESPKPVSRSNSAQKSFKFEDTGDKNESRLIRKSLSTLGYIIKALSKGGSSKGLPFRDSLLTWLLKDALTNGKCHTTMVSTVSPSHICYDETLATLKYAQRLSMINRSANEVKWADQLVTDNGLEDVKKLQAELGANKKGTEAARVLLKQTVNDPQQSNDKDEFIL